MSIRALVTSSGSLLGQGIIRSLLESKLDITVIACDPDPRSAGLYWTEERYLLPVAKDPDFLEKFTDTLKVAKPNVVLVGTDAELPLLAQHREILEQDYQTKIIVSSPEVVKIADDKYLTAQFLTDNGFPAPKSCLPDENLSLGLHDFIQIGGFPLIVKPRIGARSVGLYLVNSGRELALALTEVPNAVVQECVGTPDQEYTAGALCFDGVCQASIVMRRDLRDGNTYRAYVDQYPELNAQVKKICEALNPFGPANFQFRTSKTGELKVFEINSRFSGTTPLRLRVGFNEVEMTLRKVLLNEPIQQPEISSAIIMRHWTETVIKPEELLCK